MSILATATKPKPKAPIITLVGGAGVGKTSLAAMFPNPIFIQAETATAALETWEENEQPAFLPQLTAARKDVHSTYGEIRNILVALYSEDHDYKTVVIDTVTALNVMFEKEIAMNDNVSNVADAAGGFHKGYTVLKNYHDNIRIACEALATKKGITVVYLAHTGIEKVKHDPSETSEYSIHSLQMHKDSAKIYIDNSDAVLYIEQPKFISSVTKDKQGKQTGTGRAIIDDKRVIITTGAGTSGYSYAKNRYNMPAELELEYKTNPLLQYIPFFNQEGK